MDGLAAFVGPGRVLVEAAFDGAHPRYDVLMENRRALEGQTDAKGRILDLIFIEDAWHRSEGAHAELQSHSEIGCRLLREKKKQRGRKTSQK